MFLSALHREDDAINSIFMSSGKMHKEHQGVPSPRRADDQGVGALIQRGGRKVRLIGRPLMRPPGGRN